MEWLVYENLRIFCWKFHQKKMKKKNISKEFSSLKTFLITKINILWSHCCLMYVQVLNISTDRIFVCAIFILYYWNLAYEHHIRVCGAMGWDVQLRSISPTTTTQKFGIFNLFQSFSPSKEQLNHIDIRLISIWCARVRVSCMHNIVIPFPHNLEYLMPFNTLIFDINATQ